MTRPILPSLALGALLALTAGCTSRLRTDVVTFHEGPLPAGESIRVVPLDPADAGSLEFRNYARLITEELRKIGYTPVAEDAAASELLAEVTYDVELGPTTVSVSDPGPFVRYHFYYGRYYDPFYFGIYDTWGPQVRTSPSYLRTLELNITRADARDEHVFEGRVQSSGRQSMLAPVMPYLITAMFTNFPGESGVTKVVTIEMDE